MARSYIIFDMNNEEIIIKVEEKIGYEFKNRKLLLEAITHSSYANEMKINKRPHYERLEFLGDAVLELISSEYLYDKYPNVPEGGLSKKRASMVCEQSLSIVGRRMELGSFIYFGKGEETSGGREKDSIIADVVEAILGAIYLDAGMDEARKYVNAHILYDLRDDELFVDSKSILMEKVLQIFPGENARFEITDESGPEHDKTFTATAYVGDKIIAKGTGKTKKAATQSAANEALNSLKNMNG